MKVLVLLTDLLGGVGGIQTFNRTLICALDNLAKKYDLSITILALNDLVDGKNGNISNKISYIEDKVYLSFNHNVFSFINSIVQRSLNSSLVIFGHIGFIPLTPLLKAINPKLKLLLSVYGIDVSKRLSLLQKIGLSKISRILSISKNTCEQMSLFNGLDKSKFDILPCTLLKTNNVVTSSKQGLMLPNGKMILTVSRLAPGDNYKNIDLVIKAMPEILKVVNDVFYIIVGGGEDQYRLKQLASNIGVQDKVIFPGGVPDDLLQSYYNACDVFVLPSIKEGFGIVFLEAMSFAKPCIGANAGGIPEVIEDTKTGFLCEPNDIKTLSTSLIKLLQDNELRLLMGQAGKKRFEENFSFNLFCNRLENILSKEEVLLSSWNR